MKRIHVDGGSPGRGAGDLDFYRELLFNKGITPTPIGHSDITCINTGTGSLNCSGTYFLPKGKIMVGGVIASRLFYELAVVGGTRLYENARGTLTATSLGRFAVARVPFSGWWPDAMPTPTILICDDEPSLRELMRVSLGEGYSFAEAADVAEAIELVDSGPSPTSCSST